jgi:hypothetical protein
MIALYIESGKRLSRRGEPSRFDADERSKARKKAAFKKR